MRSLLKFVCLMSLAVTHLSYADVALSQGSQVSEGIDQDAYQPFRLIAGELIIEITPTRAFTISSIWRGDAHVGLANGQYGFVFSSKDHHWVGTGHREGGREEVLGIELIVDGQQREVPVDGGDFEVASAVIVKTSRLKSLLLTSRIELYPDRIEESQHVSFADETHIETAYAFMHCWTPKTTEWISRRKDGELAKGEFTDEG